MQPGLSNYSQTLNRAIEQCSLIFVTFAMILSAFDLVLLNSMMRKRNRFYAFLLQWVFLFPIIVQSWHPAFHHHSCESHHHTAACCENEGTRIINAHEHEDCLICEYQFPVNDLPASFELESDFIVFEEFSKKNDQQHIPDFHYLLNSPRAPPVLC